MNLIIGILATNCEGTLSSYVRAVEKAGGCPIILHRVGDIQSIEPVLKLLDGIIFTGGTDINPFLYNELPKDGLNQVDTERDRFELLLAEWILENTNIPVLGICRGMHLLNILKGGSLYQDLIKERVTPVNHLLSGVIPVNELSHSINISIGSKLYQIFSNDVISVNSSHHQGINKLGIGFETVATSEDNIIEAIEMQGERFIIGVQWHPEKISEKYDEQQRLFDTFIDFCESTLCRNER